MRYDRTVLGYHGCTSDVAAALLAGGGFKPSKNTYDWLGEGSYFWEHGPDRAGLWSTPSSATKPRTVVGAVIRLGRCFDLMDTKFTRELASAYAALATVHEGEGIELPVNSGDDPDRRKRYLDCAVINFYLAQLEAEGQPYDTVRCGFVEGAPAFPGSGILAKSHIQIAVRNPDCIVGVFQPRRLCHGEAQAPHAPARSRRARSGRRHPGPAQSARKDASDDATAGSADRDSGWNLHEAGQADEGVRRALTAAAATPVTVELFPFWKDLRSEPGVLPPQGRRPQHGR